jgi:hypothetical protein
MTQSLEISRAVLREAGTYEADVRAADAGCDLLNGAHNGKLTA